jgi:hypothetical protein
MEQKIIDKIKKLLKLGESSNQHEAASAMARAASLMDKYKIEQAILTEEEEGEEKEAISEEECILYGINKRRRSHWRRELANAIAKANGCYVFYRGAQVITLGRPSDKATMVYMFKFCEAEIDRLAKAQCVQGEHNSFRLGAARGVRDAIHEEQKEQREAMIQEEREKYETSGGTSALVVQSAIAKVETDYKELVNFVHNKYNFRRNSARASVGNYSAFAAGRQQGAGIYGASKGQRRVT